MKILEGVLINKICLYGNLLAQRMYYKPPIDKIKDDDMDISVSGHAKEHLRCRHCHGLLQNRASNCQNCAEPIHSERRPSLSHFFNQNFLYLLATASSVVAGVNYILNYYSIW